jgi:glutaredoxin
MKKNNLILIIAGVVVLLAAGYFVFSRNHQPAAEIGSGIIYFYGDTCPHCLNVEKFFEDNNIEDKVSFKKEEVFENQANANELASVAQQCKLPAAEIGVPFVWDGSKCYLGETDVINFFKEKAGIQ